MTRLEVDPVQAWVISLVAAVFGTVLGAVALPRTVYDGFLWRYFWGPVVADGRGAECVERIDGETVVHQTATACSQASGIVAEPGYTAVSTVSYGIILVFLLIGVYLGLERVSLDVDMRLFAALVPFVPLGGMLRATEDIMVALPADTAAPVPEFPLTAVLISPFIYFLVFALTIAGLGASVWAERRNLVERYDRTLLAIGIGLVGLSGIYMTVLASYLPDLHLSPAMFLATIGGATGVTAVVWWGIDRYAPVVYAGTGWIGSVIIWGHAIDGFANVLSLDWADALGLGASYSPKHVINELVIDVTAAVQPAALTDAIGSAWPFIVLKVAVAVMVIWLFNDEILEESPRFSLLMLVAVLALGLGPGSRDLIRATLGI